MEPASGGWKRPASVVPSGHVDCEGAATRSGTSVKPDLDGIQEHCAVLERLAAEHPEGSPEHAALFAAAHAMYFVSHAETLVQFREWVASWSKPPTGLQVLMAKYAGVEVLPHELLDESMRDVESLLEKLRNART